MPRPRRLFSTSDGKLYYIIDKKKVFIKTPAGISQKQISKINIKNIVNVPGRRITRRKKPKEMKYGKKIIPDMEKSETSGLPIYFFKPQRKIPSIADIQAGKSEDTSIEKLSKLLMKGISATPSSSKVSPTIAVEKGKPPADSEGESVNNEEAKRARRAAKDEKRAKKKAAEEEAKQREGYSFEEPTGRKKQIPVKELVDIIGVLDGRGVPINYAKVRDYVAEFYTQYTNVGGDKYRDALDKYKDRALASKSLAPPATPPRKTDAELMPPPAPRPPSAEKPLKNVRTFADYETDSPQGNFIRGLMAKGNLPSESETESGKEDPAIAAMIANIKGKGYDGNGLYNDEIEEVAKKRIKDYVPVIAADEINQLPKYVGRGDKRFGFIINTNPSTSDGSGKDGMRPGHWRSVYINNEDDFPTVEYFDPLCEGKMPPDLVKMSRKIAFRMNPEVLFKYKQSMIRRQSKLTSNCGWHALQFLDDRFQGKPFSQASGYDKYIEELNKVPDASRDGEKEVSKYIKKYESYI